MRAFKIAVGLCGILFVAATCTLFVWPATDRPQRVEAIVALAGDPPRDAKAWELARAGYSHVVVVSLENPHLDTCPDLEPGIEVHCFHAVPLTTQGEARYVSKLAAQHKWRRILIVPGSTQVTRARMVFRRCYADQLLVVPPDERLARLPRDIAYEWGATLKALLFKRSC